MLHELQPAGDLGRHEPIPGIAYPKLGRAVDGVRHLVHEYDGALRPMQAFVKFDRPVRFCLAEIAIDLMTHGGTMAQRLETHDMPVNEDRLGNAIAPVPRS